MSKLTLDYNTGKSINLFNFSISTALGMITTLLAKPEDGMTEEKKELIVKYKECLEDISKSLPRVSDYINSLSGN